MFEERRRHPRLIIPLEAQYRVEGSDSPQLGTLQNLSAGGAAMITADDLEAGTELTEVSFALPSKKTTPEPQIKVKAVVVRNEPHLGVGRENEKKLGLTFVYANDDDFKRVHDYVFERLRRGDRAADFVPIEKRRIPFYEPVVVTYDKYEDFVEEISENLSMNGMFVRSVQPKRPGTAFSFEFRLGEDMPLIQGRAEVAWRRPTSEGPDKPAGMGARFLSIDITSRDLIKRLVKEHTRRKMLEEGIQIEPSTRKRVARPVEPVSARPAAAEVVAEPREFATTADERPEVAPDFPVPAPQPAESTGQGGKTPLVIGLIAAVVLIALVLVLWLTQRDAQPVAEAPVVTKTRLEARRQAARPPPSPPAEVRDQNEPVEVAAVEDTSDPAPGLPEPVEATVMGAAELAAEEPAPTGGPTRIATGGSGDLSRVGPTVVAWAQAWSERRVDDYLDFYANEFIPPDGLSRDDWETQRFSRLRKPAWIRVELNEMRQQPLGANRVSVTFSQAYSSDIFSDSVVKTLELVWEKDAWKIASESSS